MHHQPQIWGPPPGLLPIPTDPPGLPHMGPPPPPGPPLAQPPPAQPRLPSVREFFEENPHLRTSRSLGGALDRAGEAEETHISAQTTADTAAGGEIGRPSTPPAGNPLKPPPRGGGGGEQTVAGGEAPDAKKTMKLVRLSNPDNVKKWSSDALRVSLEQTAKVMLPGEVCTIHPVEGGFEGPYNIAMSDALARALIEDGYTDLYDTEEGAEVEPISFKVTELDAQGRPMTDAVRQRVEAARSSRRAESDLEERQRTIPFIFNGTPEIVLRMDDPPALEKAVGAVVEKIRSCITNIERSNVHQLLDRTGRPIASWIFFVVLENTSDLRESVQWPRIKWIVWNQMCQPVRVRVSGNLLASLGREQCCFMHTRECDLKGHGQVRCQARDRVMRLITLPSSIPRGGAKQERAEKRERQDQQRRATKIQMTVAQASRTVRQCDLFTLGKCMKGYGTNRPCQRKHGDASAIGCYFHEGEFPITGACTGGEECPYNHTFPNALRMEQCEAARRAGEGLPDPGELGGEEGSEQPLSQEADAEMAEGEAGSAAAP